jgi:uncharacterized protein YecA (UPF0149 family)
MEETKEYVSKDVEQKIIEVPTVQVMPETGTIMDAVKMSEENDKKREAMEAAMSNDQMKKFEAMAKAYQNAHTQKVRKYDKIGRNDPCPCGSGKKFKNCCINKKDWNELVPVKKK